MILPAYGSEDEIPGIEDAGIEVMDELERTLVFEPGTRRARSAEIAMVSRTGVRHVIQLEPLICFRMKGIGYMHPEWGHGRWKGELAVGGESWKCDDLEPMALENQHIQQVMRARWGDREGIGVLEQLCLGAHADFGFEEFLDGAA